MHQGPAVGEKAPHFDLSSHDGTRRIALNELVGEKPIVLVFGNFTCGPFRRNFPEVNDLVHRYKEQATFIGIYVREAHPSDGWSMESNSKLGVQFAQPQSFDQKIAIAKTCQSNLRYNMPLLVDDIEDSIGNAYSGMPSRLYVVGRTGIVTYKSGRGPYGFKPEK